MPTFTRAGAVLVPLLILPYALDRPTGSTVHTLEDGSTAVTSTGTGKRASTLNLLLDTRADVAAAEAFFSDPAPFTLADAAVLPSPVLATLGAGYLTATLDPLTRRHWILAVPIVEVGA
jgi:hypothetical protein